MHLLEHRIRGKRPTEFRQRTVLDLSHAFLDNAEPITDLLQRAPRLVIHREAVRKDASFQHRQVGDVVGKSVAQPLDVQTRTAEILAWSRPFRLACGLCARGKRG